MCVFETKSFRAHVSIVERTIELCSALDAKFSCTNGPNNCHMVWLGYNSSFMRFWDIEILDARTCAAERELMPKSVRYKIFTCECSQ